MHQLQLSFSIGNYVCNKGERQHSSGILELLTVGLGLQLGIQKRSRALGSQSCTTVGLCNICLIVSVTKS